MDEKVKACLDEQRKESEKLDKKNKRKLLAELGIYNKEYSDTYGNGYVQYDNETKKYYKIVFPDISDEEYLELKTKSDSSKEKDKSENPIASALHVIGIVILVIGALAGLIYIAESFVITAVVWGSTFISGMMFLGFAEIIKLLHSINNKIK